MSNVDQQSEILLYQTEDGLTRIDVTLVHETIWLPLAQIAELFDVQKPAISKHLKNIFDTEELSREAAVSKMETVQIEGGREIKRNMEFYNLDAIIAIGYRVNSRRATQFRQWATQREYLVRGFSMDDNRLKQADKWN